MSHYKCTYGVGESISFIDSDMNAYVKISEYLNFRPFWEKQDLYSMIGQNVMPDADCPRWMFRVYVASNRGESTMIASSYKDLLSAQKWVMRKKIQNLRDSMDEVQFEAEIDFEMLKN
jgi:hypothetical protein